jgi:hypothetical protein
LFSVSQSIASFSLVDMEMGEALAPPIHVSWV